MTVGRPGHPQVMRVEITGSLVPFEQVLSHEQDREAEPNMGEGIASAMSSP